MGVSKQSELWTASVINNKQITTASCETNMN